MGKIIICKAENMITHVCSHHINPIVAQFINCNVFLLPKTKCNVRDDRLLCSAECNVFSRTNITDRPTIWGGGIVFPTFPAHNDRIWVARRRWPGAVLEAGEEEGRGGGEGEIREPTWPSS